MQQNASTGMHEGLNTLVRAKLISFHVSVIPLQLEQDIEAQLIAESLYEYIDKQWVSGYVIIDELEAQGLDPRPFPMQGD